MSLSMLALVLGILVGFMLSLVIMSLLSMAKLGDAYLELLDRVAQERRRFRNSRAGMEVIPKIPVERNDYQKTEVSNTL